MKNQIQSLAAGLLAAVILTACGGGSDGPTTLGATSSPVGGATPPLVTSKLYTELETREEAARFLMQAGFGGTDAQIDALVGTDAADWIVNEMRKPATLMLPEMQRRYPTREDTDNHHSRLVWQTLLTADDQLRQRMMFALSQIFVVSTNGAFDQGFMTADYTDILTRQAFGNYRELLDNVTYSPAMSRYLTYYRNRKGDERSGRMPDENYAREVLQLFSIGLVELEMDGTPKAGAPETYDNDDIVGLARVFTGLSGEGTGFNSGDHVDDWRIHPLKMFDEQHSALEKAFLGTTVPENTSGTETIQTALDTIANHPNIAPFISRQFIQRFTASSPSPEYVRRVAEVFEAGTYRAPNGQAFGTGNRGNFQAVIAAILLDESVHDEVQADTEGKVREPVLKLIHYTRSFDVDNIDVWEEWRFNNTSDPNASLGQHPLRSPSVFNFYRPGYLAPGSESGEAALSAPEFQIVNESASLGFTNFLTHYIMRPADDPDRYPGFQPDFTTEIGLADDVKALVAHLNVKLTAGQLSDVAKADIIDVVSTLIIDGDDAAEDRRKRVQTAILMMTASAAFAVQN